MYGKHPSKRLNDIFSGKPHQGQDPQKATVIIVGIDANYIEDIDKYPSFSLIEKYHSNGVQFWKDNAKHHPFLLDEYKKQYGAVHGGVRYHRNFARLYDPVEWAKHMTRNFTESDKNRWAESISFVELLNVATVDNSIAKEQNKEQKKYEKKEVFSELINPDYLQSLDSIIKSDPIGKSGTRLILLSDGVIAKMIEIRKKYKEQGIFNWLPDHIDKRVPPKITWLNTKLHHKVGIAYHFSSWYRQINNQIPELRQMIDRHCK